MSDQRRKALLTGGAIISLFVLLYVAWGISALTGGDLVARNVSVDGVAIGGLDEDDVRAVASDFDTQLAGQPATVMVGDVEIATNLAELGVHTDAEQLVIDAFEARKGGAAIFRPFSWVGSFFGTAEIERQLLVDEAEAEANTMALIEGQLSEPTDPTFSVTDSGVTVMAGIDGATIERAGIADQVQTALDNGEPFIVTIAPVPLAPSLETATLEALAAEANAATSEQLEVSVLTQSVVIEPAMLRSWVMLDVSGAAPIWQLDNDKLITDLLPLFPALGSEDQNARFDVVGGSPIIIPANESVLCCGDDSAADVRDALLQPAPERDPEADEDDPAPLRSVELAPITSGGDEGVAELEALGIVEEVATFTTNHACCQGRVQNIQRMAGIVQGYIIRPGEVFDLNDITGRRTTANGFVAAGAIAEGVIEAQVGGGVSQFVTTMFNASFFAGLEFVEYQAHSIYFSRYPRGREATISFPKPDFIVRNTTPHGILVWPTWNDTSITVTLYSTEFVDVEDIGRTESPQGSCTRVTTTRQLTYQDGTVETDTVFAVYRPGEGLDCNGNSTRPTTTTIPDDTSTTEAGGSTTETTAGGGETTETTTATTAPASSETTAPATTEPLVDEGDGGGE